MQFLNEKRQICVFRRKYVYSAALVPARQPANLRWTFRTHAFTANDRGHVRTITLRLFPAAACEVQCKCKTYFATRPGPRTPTGVRQEMQTVFQQKHAAYDRSLRQSPPAAAEWAKPREIRRGTRSSVAYEGCLQAVPNNFNTLTPKLLSGGTRATRPTGPPRPGAPEYRESSTKIAFFGPTMRIS